LSLSRAGNNEESWAMKFPGNYFDVLGVKAIHVEHFFLKRFAQNWPAQ
jgi:hypothetical protein